MIKYLIVDMNPIASLQVYCIMTEEDYAKQTSFEGKVYWSDSKAVSGQGPFKTVYEALDNYKKLVLIRRDIAESDSILAYQAVQQQFNAVAIASPNIAAPNGGKIIRFKEWKESKLKYNKPGSVR